MPAFTLSDSEPRIVNEIAGEDVRYSKQWQMPKWIAAGIALAVVSLIYATVFSTAFGQWMQSNIDLAAPYLTAWKHLRDQYQLHAIIALLVLSLVCEHLHNRKRYQLLVRLVHRNRQLERLLKSP